MARPLWSDAGDEPDDVAALLATLADNAGVLKFEPRPIPDGLDRNVLHRAAILRAKLQLTSAHGEQDRILAQEVRAIDDLVRSANLLMERLREWYALHAPEAVRAEPGKNLAKLVAENDRDGVRSILAITATTLGSDLPEADVAVLRSFAGALSAIHDAWDALENRVQELMQECAPNLASVTGAVLGARLVAQAGSLQRLAGFPPGTVQTLGAEVALFRHLKEGTKPPKHGILFQHPKVHQAQAWQRGPIAKAIALQAALGAKADSYTQRDIRAELKERLEADLSYIAATRAKPKPRAYGDRGPAKFGGKSGFNKARTGGFGKRDDTRASYGKPRTGGSGSRDGDRTGGSGGYSKPSGGYSKPSGGRDDRRPSGGRDDRKPYGKPSGRDDRKPYDKSNQGGKKPYAKKKPAGAFRGDGGPAAPPGGRK